MRRLEGKAILVAGGGGIGGGLARRFASEGAGVVLGDIDPYSAQKVAGDIVSQGGKAIAVHLDGADEASAKAAVDVACKTYGGLDGMHANFAVFLDARDDVDVLTCDLAAYDETMRVNARGYLVCTRAALPAILVRGGGSIVYTSSTSAYVAETSRVAYGMGKMAGHALMRHVAARFGPQGVRANCIAPGVTSNERWTPETLELVKHVGAGRPLKRAGTPAEVAALSALLMSDEGSFITGQALSIDGGWTMRP